MDRTGDFADGGIVNVGSKREELGTWPGFLSHS